MADKFAQIAKPVVDVTVDDLHDAYRLCKLRKLDYGFARAMQTPAILASLRGTAAIQKRKALAAADAIRANQQPLPLEA